MSSGVPMQPFLMNELCEMNALESGSGGSEGEGEGEGVVRVRMRVRV